ncbi:MAG TPA: thiamine phosphate synthase [Devosiaceae bacterium]|jgi:thiamine-phosphate pyrophosphorylase
MSAQIYLIAPEAAELATFAPLLTETLAAAEVAALYVPRGNHAENAYKTLIKALAPIAQAQNCAVLIEGEPGWVKTLGADGLHLLGSGKVIASAKAAASALKPRSIVGAGPVASRHDAMTLGELDLDYILFGPMTGALSAEARDMAIWWSETMEVPAVLSDPEATPENVNSSGCEFIAFGESVWKAPQGPAMALAALARSLETT